MKKNFYIQSVPSHFKGTVKRFAAAIWLSAVMLLAPVAVNAIDINLSDPGLTTSPGEYNVNSGYVELTAIGQSYTITGSGSRYIYTATTVGLVTLNNVNINSTHGVAANGVDATVNLTGNNTLSGSTNGIQVTSGNTLTIGGSGTLNTTVINVLGNLVFNNTGTIIASSLTVDASSNLTINRGTIVAGSTYFGAASVLWANGGSFNPGTITSGGTYYVSCYGENASLVKLTGFVPNAAISPINFSPTPTYALAYNGAGIKADASGTIYLWLGYGFDYDINANVGGWSYTNEDNKSVDNTNNSVIPMTGYGFSNSNLVNPNVLSNWNPGWDTGNASDVHSGCPIDITFNIIPAAGSRKVTIEVSGKAKDYISVPKELTLEGGKDKITIHVGLASFPAELEGTSVTIVATPEGSTPVSASRNIFSSLTNKNVTINYNPKTTLYPGSPITLTVESGSKRHYWYSVDEGRSWKSGNKDEIKDILAPTDLVAIWVKAGNSCGFVSIPLIPETSVPHPVLRPISIPLVPGAKTFPPNGAHFVKSATDYVFVVIPDDAGKSLKVSTDRTLLPDDADNLKVIPDGDGSFTVIIRHVQEAVNVSIDLITGNATVNDGSIYGVEGGVKVIGAQGTIAIYTIDGRLIKSTVAEGDEQFIAAPRGIVIVKNGTKIAKVVVK